MRRHLGTFIPIPVRYHQYRRPGPIAAPILIVEDVEETRSVLRRVLQLRGYATAEAGSAGLPVAVQVAARQGDDEVVLTLLERISSH